MDILQAVQALRNLGVSLNDYDSEALEAVCDFAEDKLKQDAAAGVTNSVWLQQRLANPELDVYAAVVLARQDLALGRVAAAISRLRVDADKLRMYDKELAAALLAATPQDKGQQA